MNGQVDDKIVNALRDFSLWSKSDKWGMVEYMEKIDNALLPLLESLFRQKHNAEILGKLEKSPLQKFERKDIKKILER